MYLGVQKGSFHHLWSLTDRLLARPFLSIPNSCNCSVIGCYGGLFAYGVTFSKFVQTPLLGLSARRQQLITSESEMAFCEVNFDVCLHGENQAE